MSRLIRMDQTGHTTLAEWTAEIKPARRRQIAAFRDELDQGYFAPSRTARATPSRCESLPLDAPLVILRRPIAGG